MSTKKEIQTGGKTLSLETGAVARRANGAFMISYGDTVVLATACFKEGTVIGDFMPLTVDYKEYTYAGGRIPGGFFKREGRPTEKEILTSRLIDRPLRPSFVKGYRQETQIIALVLSADGENDPDILAINAASTALVISEIPFVNAMSAVRVGSVDELTSKYGATLPESMLTFGKQARRDAMRALKAQILASVPREDIERLAAAQAAFEEMEKRIFREVVVQEHKRVDGRAFNEIRPI